jgi:mevalonate kinase
MSYKASAPGSIMLLGEYGVLFGKPALVCAIDKRIHVELIPRADSLINIHSDVLGRYSTDLQSLQLEQPFHFVLGAIKQYQAKLRRGFDLQITSEFSDKVGLGSSAAVTVATLAALVTWLDIRMLPLDMIRQGRHVVRECQGLGSGADVAASVYGGVVYYHSQPLAAEKIAIKVPITLYYTGFKTPTVTAVKQVQATFMHYPQIFKQLCASIGQCATDGMQWVRRQDWQKLGEVLNIQQGLMESLGVSMPILQQMTRVLREQNGISGAKISGSGLGDCVVGLGEIDANLNFGGDYAGIQLIPVEMTLHGVQGEKS